MSDDNPELEALFDSIAYPPSPSRKNRPPGQSPSTRRIWKACSIALLRPWRAMAPRARKEPAPSACSRNWVR